MTKLFHDPLVHGHMHLQELANTYHHINKIRTRCYHSLLNHYLPLFFPEFERYMHSSKSEWFSRFLLRFPTPGSVSALSLDEFVSQAWDVISRKTSKRRLLDDIYHTAQHSIALPIEQDDLAVETFQLQVRRYHELTQNIHHLQNRAEQTLNDDPDYHRLRTMPGIGPIISLIILAESGDLRRFPHHRQYLSFCGFNLSTAQSGQFQGRSKMSKRGNARLRYAYWLAAVGAIRQRENSFRYKYERCHACSLFISGHNFISINKLQLSPKAEKT